MSKAYFSQQVCITPFANGRCQSLLQSTRMGSNPLIMVNVKIMVDVKVYHGQQDWVHSFANSGCESLLQSTRMDSNSLIMVDVKVYHGQQDWDHSFANWMSKSTTVN